MQKNNTKKYFIVFILAIDIALLGLLVWLVLQVNNLSGQNAVLKSQIDDFAIKNSEVSTNKTGLDQIDSSLKILNEYFVPSEEKVLMIDNLEKLASRAEINYTLNNATDGEQVSLDISVKESFRNIYYFIRLLETGGYWVSFEKISLSRGTDKAAGVWSGSLVISIPQSFPNK